MHYNQIYYQIIHQLGKKGLNYQAAAAFSIKIES